jgi:hypothetical protein
MSNILWGTGYPVIIIQRTSLWIRNDATNIMIIQVQPVPPPPASPIASTINLPYPSFKKLEFRPDAIMHKLYNGERLENCRGFYLYYEAYWDKLTRAQAEDIRNIIVASHSGMLLLLKPHNDYSVSYEVKVNEEEGWNAELVMNKQCNGYEATIICRGTEWQSTIPLPMADDGSDDWRKFIDISNIPANIVLT